MFSRPSLSINDLAEDIEYLVAQRPMTALELSKALSVPLDTLYRAMSRIHPNLKISKQKYSLK